MLEGGDGMKYFSADECQCSVGHIALHAKYLVFFVLEQRKKGVVIVRPAYKMLFQTKSSRGNWLEESA